MSTEADAVFGCAHRFSEHVHRVAERRETWANLQACKRCGACAHWMKSRDCPREKNVNGQTRGPSSRDIPCGKFEESASATKHREGLQAKYAELSQSTQRPSHED